jgi:hypothetical protein
MSEPAKPGVDLAEMQQGHDWFCGKVSFAAETTVIQDDSGDPQIERPDVQRLAACLSGVFAQDGAVGRSLSSHSV